MKVVIRSCLMVGLMMGVSFGAQECPAELQMNQVKQLFGGQTVEVNQKKLSLVMGGHSKGADPSKHSKLTGKLAKAVFDKEENNAGTITCWYRYTSATESLKRESKRKKENFSVRLEK